MSQACLAARARRIIARQWGERLDAQPLRACRIGPIVTEAATQDVFDAFLSYSSDDVEWVAALRAALVKKGLKVWLDRSELRPGDRFVAVLEQALSSVNSVVLIVSPASLRSSWVEDEYHRALTLSNADPAKCRLIAVLIGDAELPGFLANRHWVDFRDAATFVESLDQLVFGITGHRDGATGDAAGAAMPFRASVSAGPAPGIDEVICLTRAIDRIHAEARQLRHYRLLALLPGVGIATACAALMREAQLLFLAEVIVAAPLVTGLVGWGAAAPSLAQCSRKLEQFELLRDGLEACRARTIPGCSGLRANFWKMMLRQTNALGAEQTP
jgi:hypothetical protein